MSIKTTIKFSYCIIALLGSCAAAHAQQPEGKKGKTIDVTSVFKPVLRDAAKINFNAAPPIIDSSKPRLTYNIPVQNLVFSYQPAEMKPVALQMDSLNAWKYSNYIKAGIGNVHQPFVKAGFSFGDGKNTYFNIFANAYTSKGSLPFQKNNYTAIGASATYKTPKNLEWNGSLGFKSEDYYLFGFRPDTLHFAKSDLLQRFQTLEGKVYFRNIIPTQFGLSYHPSLKVSVFQDNHSAKATESNTVLDLPLEKTFGKSFGLDIGATANLTNYMRQGAAKTTNQNNLYLISTAVLIKTPNLYLHAGLLPSWDNRVFTMLPNFLADITTNDQRLTLQLGWIGYYDKGSYQRFASINPWLAQPDSLLNTRVTQEYAGFKGSVGNHFSYSAKLAFLRYRNMPLFVNDNGDGKTFLVRYEPRIDALQLHSEITYNIAEDFSATASATLNQFTKVQNEKKAWGLIPAELSAGIRYQVLKDLLLRTDLWVFDGAQYQAKSGDSFKGQGGFDLGAGVEFRITKNFNLWMNLNNILNNKYERWHQYQVYGFNILGGLTYSFNQK